MHPEAPALTTAPATPLWSGGSMGSPQQFPNLQALKVLQENHIHSSPRGVFFSQLNDLGAVWIGWAWLPFMPVGQLLSNPHQHHNAERGAGMQLLGHPLGVQDPHPHECARGPPRGRNQSHGLCLGDADSGNRLARLGCSNCPALFTWSLEEEACFPFGQFPELSSCNVYSIPSKNYSPGAFDVF